MVGASETVKNCSSIHLPNRAFILLLASIETTVDKRHALKTFNEHWRY